MSILTNAEWYRSQFDSLGLCESYQVKVKGDQSETHWLRVSLTTMCELQTAMVGEKAVPQWINDYRVMAYVRVPTRKGEHPTQGIAVVDTEQGHPDDPTRRYRVWDVKYDGNRWVAFNGTLYLNQQDALAVYAQRTTDNLTSRTWVE